MNEDSLYNRLAKGILTDEEINNLVDEIMNIPVEKNNNCLSSYGSINVDDLIDSIKELRKVPTYDELLRENKQLKEQLQQKDNENKELCKKIKTNEKSRRKMQKSLMEKLQQKEDIINKARKYINNNPLYDIDVYENNTYLSGIDDEQTRKELLEILDNKGE